MTKKRENLFAKHLKTGWQPFDTYLVKIRVGALVGGLPKDPNMVAGWVNATNKKKSDADRAAIVEAHLEHLPDVEEDKKEKQGIGFARDGGELCIEGRQVKAMLKEAANIIKNVAPGGPLTALKSRVADQVFVSELYIPVGRTKPDRIVERAIHVLTPQGPRDSIKVCEVCDDVELEFTVRRMVRAGKRTVSEKVLLAILDYGQNVGLGADRSQGYGVFEILSVEKTISATVK